MICDLRAFGLRLAAARYFNRLCIWWGDRLIFSEGSAMDSKLIRAAEWFCIAIVTLGIAWVVVQVFCLALADMSASDVWRKP